MTDSFYPNPEKPTILLTGATGMVGQFVLKELLEQGGQLAVLVRGKMGVDVRFRLEALCRFWERRLGRILPRPKALQADLHVEGLGLRPADQRWIEENVDCLLHNAASVRFLNDDRGFEPRATNVDGTRRMLEMAARLQVPRFCHVSTAYVCGDRTGVIRESEVQVGQTFNNPYEASKCEAEQLVLANAAHFQHVSIYRPSVVVGDSRDGFTPTFQTIYSILRYLVHLAGDIQEDTMGQFRAFQLTGEEQKNLVPVDWVARTMVRLVHETRDGIFHLTHPRPVTLQQVAAAIGEAIGHERAHWDAMSAAVPKLTIANAAQQNFNPFAGYFRTDPTFDTQELRGHLSDIDPPIMDHEMLVRVFRFAIAQRLQQRPLPIHTSCPGWFPQLDAPPASTALPGSNDIGMGQAASGEMAAGGFGESLDAASNVPTYRLQLIGEFGGSWDLPVAVRHARGLEGLTMLGEVRTTSQMWHHLVHRKVGLVEAMQRNRVLMFAPSEHQAILLESLREVLTRLAKSASSVGSAGGAQV